MPGRSKQEDGSFEQIIEEPCSSTEHTDVDGRYISDLSLKTLLVVTGQGRSVTLIGYLQHQGCPDTYVKLAQWVCSWHVGS